MWQKAKVCLEANPVQTPGLTVNDDDGIVTFRAWGTAFNELCWDALGVLTREEQAVHYPFHPGGPKV